MHGWDAALGEMAVPLGPQRVVLIGQVEGVNYLAALPAIITGWVRPNRGIRVVWNVTQPGAYCVDCIDVESQGARPQTAPGDSSSDTTRATVRTLPRAISSSGF